jgi:CBS domain-containing protein
MEHVSDVMTRGVRSMRPDDNAQLAAQAMDELDVGVIPVCDGDRLVGMVTDRDITLRVVAQGRQPQQTQLHELMSPDVQTCREDDDLEEAAMLMEQAQIRRLPVIDDQGRLVGMLSLGDIATKGDPDQASDALSGISEPSEPDRSTLSSASGSAGGGQTGQTAKRPG